MIAKEGEVIPMASENGFLYRGRKIALLTQHGKERVIAPVLGPALGCQVERVAGYDTDLLGTFTRDIPRAGTQIEAARKKARTGMSLSGLSIGIASEGSFGPDPFAGVFPWNLEILIFIDDERDIEICGAAQGKANFSHSLASGWSEAESFAREAGFPGQHLVVRPEGEIDPRIRKGIASWKDLENAFEWASGQSKTGQVFLETDGRAHANPVRMENIRLASEDLLRKILSACPACNAPGFWVVDRIPGLPCRNCGGGTQDFLADVYGCIKCGHRARQERSDWKYADPLHCDYCNP
jgi:Zn ribbon nucleic-acid-binding protein